MKATVAGAKAATPKQKQEKKKKEKPEVTSELKELVEGVDWNPERRKLGELAPAEWNPRKLSKAQYKELERSLAKFNLIEPVVINTDNEIIGGHQRVKVLLELRGADYEVWAMLPSRTLTPEEVKEANIRLNKNTGEFDELKLQEFFSREELMDWGFTKDEMKAWVKLDTVEQGLTDEDAVPEVLEPVSQLGDIWYLDGHKVICGDSTRHDTVSALLNGVTPHLMVTDPPYGVEYDAEWRVRAGVNAPTAAHGKVLNDDRADWREAWALFPGDVAYVWHAAIMAHSVALSLIATGFDIRSQIIWGKSNIVMSRGHYHWKHEPCWYVVREGKNGHWQGSRKESTLWEIDKPQKNETGHSTQKPVECMRKPIENNSTEGDLVYDPFLGSGTTVIAAEQAKRKCYGVELNPLYVDIIVTRWQNYTGKTATHLTSGKTFEELKQERKANGTTNNQA